MNLNNSNTPNEEKDRAATPQWFVNLTEYIFNIKFMLDVCAERETTKVGNIYLGLDKGGNGLIDPWSDMNWCNPPFSNIDPWIKKAFIEAGKGGTTFMLLPDKSETGYSRYAFEVSDTKIQMHRRLSFLRPNGEPFLTSEGKKQGPQFSVCLYIITPQGLDMPCRVIYGDFRE